MDGKLMVCKRNGEVVPFDASRIQNAVAKAVIASGSPLPAAAAERLTEDVVGEVQTRFIDFYPNVENIQDIVEKHLVKAGHYEVAKAYILYRAKRQKEREEEKKRNVEKSLLGKLTVRKRDGRLVLFDVQKVRGTLERHSREFSGVPLDAVINEVVKNIYDGVSTEEIEKAMVLASIAFIEKDPGFDFVSARLFLQKLYKEVCGQSLRDERLQQVAYRESFVRNIQAGVKQGTLDERLLEFDLKSLSEGLLLERDSLFRYMGIQTLYDRYLMKWDEQRRELPQSFWMRVAMGLCLNEEGDRTARALEFYEMISSLRFVPSTPTLFHSGTAHPQLSSCYLTTVTDDLTHIFKCIGDNAQLSKWSGGLGNDWSNIRATGSWIKSTGVESQGVIPFLKIANDVTVAINRSGKRRGATCAYLETWHLDIEDFLDLRKNTGDERRRTHDMNTANWIPDLFMKRVLKDESWTLFSPEEVPELHHLYGRAFETKYEEYEERARAGSMKKHKLVSAQKLWRKMLTSLFETGHPWITFKDPCNVRSPQDHVGVVHSSNLCTEITLNTSAEETAVCNLGSVNLERHIVDGKLDAELLAQTVRCAIRMLDNVVDVNYYPTLEAKTSNMRHRPIGLGIMGFQDALFKMDYAFDSLEALEFADYSMELVSYYAILSSSELAKERGPYETYPGSKWDRGLFPVDTVDLLEKERGLKIDVPRTARLDWTPVRAHVRQFGMRNSNTMAIAPTATISNISGCYPSIEPIYKNMYVKANISGEFTVVNSYLIDDLKKLGLWGQEMLEQMKYHDGNVAAVPGVPEKLKAKYKEAFDVDAETMVKMAAYRGKWIDQSQSLNVFLKGLSGKRLNDVYAYAWLLGLKTTYYLRSLAASQIEKSTLDAEKFGFTQKRTQDAVAASAPTAQAIAEAAVAQAAAAPSSSMASSGPKVCLIDDPTCEACQ
ncbi:ribonucleoside-diphosphate reductase subunit alpha [Candidatus Micrarchaeota archaeon]|nr:ribonucleoside-diphosphate reductase subunit alpha [Candidatus Micrarchaeota archaeon]